MDYATFRTTADCLSNQVSEAGSALAAVRDQIAAELGIAPSGPLGLTPDAIRARPAWRAAKLALDNAFHALRQHNGRHAKRFAKETRADIAARRLANLEASA